MISEYVMGGCSALGQDVVGNCALVTGVSRLSCGAGGADVPCRLDGPSAHQSVLQAD